MKKIAVVLLVVLIVASLFGCSIIARKTGGKATEKPKVAATTAQATPTAEPTTEPTTQPLADAIVLPDGWTMDQAITAEEVMAVTGVSGYQPFPEGASDATNGNPAGSFTNKTNAKLKVGFFIFTKGKQAKCDYFKEFAVDGSVKELTSDLWDMAYLADFTDGSSAIVVLRGDVCMRINWFPEAHSGFDKEQLGRALAELAINNLYGGPKLTIAQPVEASQPPSANADLPDELPTNLTDVALLNEYATSLYMKYVSADVFTSQTFTDAEREDARKALKLVIAAMDKAIGLYDKNESLYYLRGKAYAQCYYDAGKQPDKDNGLADLKKAVDMGLSMAQAEYDKLAGS